MIEKILRHCGLWEARAPPEQDRIAACDNLTEFGGGPTHELTFVPMDEFLADF